MRGVVRRGASLHPSARTLDESEFPSDGYVEKVLGRPPEKREMRRGREKRRT